MMIQEAIKHVKANKTINRHTYIIPKNNLEPFRKDELMMIESIDEYFVVIKRHADWISYTIKSDLIKHFKLI